MIRVLLSLFFFSLVFADNFITKFEYGTMLYKNPRGIGCHGCHGKFGEGGVIATYKDVGKIVELKAPPIRGLTPQKLADGIYKAADIMPQYFLTADEILAIYSYLEEINKRRENDKR
ncbi:cytochrome C oxidase subunit III [uncultured Campylobacter sp.]|uniref:c-type cytochrome n=1 Tax=uncultured Campylobacter sp. TaxID=218934 RepID=UPI00261E6848|nr:cytochrome C oxidase subunit III [uncultured Campylobacter sp.]